ncbi:MAG TPA: hypothetical protein VKB68_04880 [Stellaceae bacterium]|nr:hypothetical protein [Stellaceae bacterium]
MTNIAAADTGPALQIRLANLWWVVLAVAVMIAAIASHVLWLLNFVHVLAGLMWTGIDLFMGFVIGPILRSCDLPTRRAFITRLMPRMLFLMPTLAAVTGTAGWFLAKDMGFLDVGYPQFYWVLTALILIALLTIQGFGILLPTNLRVCLEMQRPAPDAGKIGRWMRRYVRTVALQGLMQVAMIVVMARFATGL